MKCVQIRIVMNVPCMMIVTNKEIEVKEQKSEKNVTVKVVYLNGYFEFVRNVENICTNNMWFVLILKSGTIKKLDRRLKLEVSYQEVG